MSPGPPKQRVAIIGGGPAALAAAFELTADNRHEQFDVTIYQQGWRLGGKCASGRNPEPALAQRIEEHGLHIWFGCYENTRRVLERCYAELGPASPYRSVADALEEIDTVVLGQRTEGDWSLVDVTFPRNPTAPINFAGFLSEALAWVARQAGQIAFDAGPERANDPTFSFFADLEAGEPTRNQSYADEVKTRTDAMSAQLIEGFDAQTPERFNAEFASRGLPDPLALIDDLLTFGSQVWPGSGQQSADERFYADVVELVLTILRGIWSDRLLVRGFDAINDLDLVEWLGLHGMQFAADPHDWPALVRAVYSGCFAFEKGDPNRPRMAAGRAIQGAIRCVLHYRTSVLCRPRGSMSDVVVGPIAQALETRGVKIRYFHAAAELRPTAGSSRIDEIDIVHQVPGAKDFRHEHGPRGVTWSTSPPKAALNGVALAGRTPVLLEHEINPFGGEVVPIRADDPNDGFDWVILAVPPDVQREICGPLTKPGYQRMLTNSASVITQAGQIWLSRTPTDLGQRFTSESLLSTYIEPLDTYADMAHIRGHEQWKPGQDVRHIAYFCGVLPHDGLTNQRTADASARRHLVELLEEHMSTLWPQCAGSSGRGFRWDALVPRPADMSTGARALEQQYCRANWAMTERYVLTLPGSVKHRLAADESGYENLVLAGDWTVSGLDAGCLEAAVTSGRLAARAICGAPKLTDIPGVNGPPGFPNRR